MSKRNYFKVKSTSSIKKKSYFNEYTQYNIPKEKNLEEWFKKEEERIRKKRNW